MENQKNNNIDRKTFINIILCVLVVILVGYIIIDISADKLKNKMEEPSIDIKPVENAIRISDDKLEQYVSYINPLSIGPSELIYNVDKVIAKELSIEDKIKYSGSYIYSKHTTSEDGQFDIISKEELKKALNTVYGPGNIYVDKFNLGCGDFVLRDDGNYYSETGCGGTSTTYVKSLITDYKATDKTIDITVVYAIYDGETNKLYKNYDKTSELKDFKGNQTNYQEKVDEYVKNNKDVLNQIIYTFEDIKGGYYFKQLTKKIIYY